MKEIGRQLAANELKEKTIVCLGKVSIPGYMVTCWVTTIGQDFVAFTMGVIVTTLIARIREDGKLTDDSGIELEVFEYLGPT